jgi:hypothetical protein
MTRNEDSVLTDQTAAAGAQKGNFIAPPELAEGDERSDAMPQQEEFWRPSDAPPRTLPHPAFLESSYPLRASQ